jgi:hypothetical protein
MCSSAAIVVPLRRERKDPESHLGASRWLLVRVAAPGCTSHHISTQHCSAACAAGGGQRRVLPTHVVATTPT